MVGKVLMSLAKGFQITVLEIYNNSATDARSAGLASGPELGSGHQGLPKGGLCTLGVRISSSVY